MPGENLSIGTNPGPIDCLPSGLLPLEAIATLGLYIAIYHDHVVWEVHCQPSLPLTLLAFESHGFRYTR